VRGSRNWQPKTSDVVQHSTWQMHQHTCHSVLMLQNMPSKSTHTGKEVIIPGIIQHLFFSLGSIREPRRLAQRCWHERTIVHA
jgi:hypothetical protein